jgi:hypothetical protein
MQHGMQHGLARKMVDGQKKRSGPFAATATAMVPCVAGYST